MAIWQQFTVAKDSWVLAGSFVAVLIVLVVMMALRKPNPLYRNDLEGLVEKTEVHIPTEIFVETSWAESCCDPRSAIVTYSQSDSFDRTLPDGALLLQDFMSSRECAKIIRSAEAYGFGSTQYPKAYRGNERLTTTDHSLAMIAWACIEPFVSSWLTLDDGSGWESIGLNETWRLSKYGPGDDFKIHLDGKYLRNQNEQSMFTVNTYLNEDFDGGSTRFYNTERNCIARSIKPITGLCLIFR